MLLPLLADTEHIAGGALGGGGIIVLVIAVIRRYFPGAWSWLLGAWVDTRKTIREQNTADHKAELEKREAEHLQQLSERETEASHWREQYLHFAEMIRIELQDVQKSLRDTEQKHADACQREARALGELAACRIISAEKDNQIAILQKQLAPGAKP
jgi:hypothetical protein